MKVGRNKIKITTTSGSALIVLPTNSSHLVPDHASPQSTPVPDPAHALQTTTDHAVHLQMTQAHEDVHEDDDDHTPSPWAAAAAAAAPTQTHRPSQHAVPVARSGADAQTAVWREGHRKNPDDMWMRAVDDEGAHRLRQTKKEPVRRKRSPQMIVVESVVVTCHASSCHFLSRYPRFRSRKATVSDSNAERHCSGVHPRHRCI